MTVAGADVSGMDTKAMSQGLLNRDPIQEESRGEWLLESVEFKTWLASRDSAILWIRGIPGAGKSMLCSYTRNYLASQKCKSVALWTPTYNSYEWESEDPAKSVLRNLLDQLCAQAIPLKDGFRSERLNRMVEKRFSPASPIDLKRLQRLFQSVVNFISRNAEIYFIVDNLDNYPWIIEAFVLASAARARDLPPSRPFKLLVSYRSSCQALDHCVEDTVMSGNGIQIDLGSSSAAKLSLYRYIELTKARLTDANPKYELKIRQLADIVQQRAAGSFLWAALILENTAQRLESVSRSDALDLSQIPSTVNEIYHQRLDWALREDRTQVFQMLRWIVYAARPLSVKELNAALQNPPSCTTELSDSSVYQAEFLDLESTQTSLCGGLVLVSQDAHLVLAHRTVWEYLTYWDTNDQPPPLELNYFESHEYLAMTCLKFLSWHIQAKPSMESPQSRFVGQRLLLQYAHDHWSLHYRIAEAQSLYLTETLYDFLRLYLLRDAQEPQCWRQQADFLHSALQVGAMLGCTHLCKVLLQMGASVDFNCNWDRATPLYLASASKHGAVARLLLEHGADVNLRTAFGNTPLLTAVQNADRNLAELLIEFGADLGARRCKTDKQLGQKGDSHSDFSNLLAGSTYESNRYASESWEWAFECICRRGQCRFESHHEESDILHWNIQHEVDSDREWTALQYAAAYGYEDIVRLLLRSGAQNNVKTSSGECPRALALKNGHTEVAKLLKNSSRSATNDRSNNSDE